MTSARSAVLYFFTALAALAGLALGAQAASDCIGVSTGASFASSQHFQNTSSPAISGHVTSQRFAVAITRAASMTGNPGRSVAPDRLISNGNFLGAERRYQSAPKA